MKIWFDLKVQLKTNLNNLKMELYYFPTTKNLILEQIVQLTNQGKP